MYFTKWPRCGRVSGALISRVQLVELKTKKFSQFKILHFFLLQSIKWFNIKDLPSYKKDKSSSQALGKSSNNFFMVIPFIG